MEKLLHYAWKCRILPLRQLFTTDGQEVEIIDPGMSNPNAGPDFFNAKIRIGETMWVGNVEIHIRASDWYRHGHQDDKAYDNVILHVVGEADMDVEMSNGKTPPQMELPLPESLKQDYQTLLTTMDYPRCHHFVPTISKMLVHSWMDALLCERLKERSERVIKRLDDTGGDWNHALMITLARNFGFSLNGDAFERWGRLLPLAAAGKHRDDLMQVQALFLGTAGLLEKVNDDALKREYTFLSHKFELTDTLELKDWRYMRTRPQNFPHVRIAQLAQLFQLGGYRPESPAGGKKRQRILRTVRPEGYQQKHHRPDHHQHRCTCVVCIRQHPQRRAVSRSCHRPARVSEGREELHHAAMGGLRHQG